MAGVDLQHTNHRPNRNEEARSCQPGLGPILAATVDDHPVSVGGLVTIESPGEAETVSGKGVSRSESKKPQAVPKCSQRGGFFGTLPGPDRHKGVRRWHRVCQGAGLDESHVELVRKVGNRVPEPTTGKSEARHVQSLERVEARVCIVVHGNNST